MSTRITVKIELKQAVYQTDAFFGLYLFSGHEYIAMSLSTKHVIWTLSMGGESAFISRPNHGSFLCTKTNCQSPGWGGVSGLGTDIVMKNWEFSKPVKIL